MKELTVSLPHGKKQKIYIGSNLSERLVEITRKEYDRVFLVIDKEVYKRYKVFIQNLISKIKPVSIHVIRAGSKDLSESVKLINAMVEAELNRNSCVLAFGGGYVGDLVGFCASIYMRGIDMLYYPTTFISQADTVLGKVGVNYDNHKHILGSFFCPRYTFCDEEFYPKNVSESFLYGLVEVWKHTLIKEDKIVSDYVDGALFHKELPPFETITYRSVAAKKFFVQNDFHDTKGLHKALSLGHTLSNHLESLAEIHHGVGVLIGIIFDTFLSKELGLIDDKKMGSILRIASQFKENFTIPRSIASILKSKNFLRRVKYDKINSHSTFTFVLPTTKGYVIKKDISEIMVQNAIRSLNKFLL